MAAYLEGVKVIKSSNASVDSSSRNGNHSQSHRTSLVSSYQRRHYGTVNKGQWKANGFITHKLTESDTLQGLALRYSVPATEIQRFNNLFSNDSIHLYTELKIPYCSSMNSSPSSSPQATKRNRTPEQSIGSPCTSDEEEEVKQKPLSVLEGRALTSSGEKNIQSILDSADLQLKKSRDFAEKLAQKNSALKKDGYNREPAVDISNDETTNDSIRDKLKRAIGRKAVWSPNDNVQNREEVEDEIFQL